MNDSFIEKYVKGMFIIIPIIMVLIVIFWAVVAVLTFTHGPEFVGDFLQRAKDAYND